MQAGQSIGRFRLLEKIGKGGMAEIFKASEALPGGQSRTVAIKRLFPKLSADREFVGMFVNEARIAAEMDHPCIIRTYDLINYGSYYYIVMEYLEGMDLEDLVFLRAPEGMALSLAEIALVVHDVAMGLHYAHARRDSSSGPVVHRDISPGNILLGTGGEVKITDFGIARATQYASFTRPGILKGKYEYMAPEYVKGEQFDGRADLFSLGVVLYELLTGSNPFTGVTPHDVWNRILTYEPEPPSKVVPGVPPLMNKVVERALCKNPRRRYGSGEEFAAVLAGFFAASGPEKVRFALGERVKRAMKPAPAEGDSGEMARFLPPETERGDSTREVYLDELLELVEPVEVPRPPPLAKGGADVTVPKGMRPLSLRRRIPWPWLLLAVLLLLSGAAAGYYFFLRTPRGFLTVTSDLRAEIFVDGRRLGLAPVQSVPLEAGQHIIKARRPGRQQTKTYHRLIEEDRHVSLKVRWQRRRPRKTRGRKRGRRRRGKRRSKRAR